MSRVRIPPNPLPYQFFLEILSERKSKVDRNNDVTLDIDLVILNTDGK